MIKAIIFDFDGTLVNTIDDVSRCFNKTLLYFGYEERDDRYIRSLIGKGLDDIAEALLPESNRALSDISLFKDRYRKIYADDPKPNTLPYNGIGDLLCKLKAKDIKIIINSNKSQTLLEDLAIKLFNDISFDLILGFTEGCPPKPSPYFMQIITQQFHVTNADVLYVGDSIIDAETAHNANIPALIVTWGIGNAYDIQKKYEINIINAANDVISYIC